MTLDYKEKVDFLSALRQRIKSKKIRFDETLKNFGFDRMNELISVKNTSEIKGYPFECYNKGEFKYALKVVPGEKKFNKDNNPSKLEITVLKKLTQDLVETYTSPHITYYLTNLKIPNRCTALKCIDLKRLEAEDRIHRNSHMLVSEYIEGGCLDSWVYDRNESDMPPSDSEWKGLVFQVLYTLFVLQNKYRLNHNDTHYGNILVDTKIKSGGYFVYKLVHADKTVTTYYVKNNGFIPKLWDFEFAMVYSDKIPGTFGNQFVIGPLEYDAKNHKTIEEYSTPEGEFEYTVPVQFSDHYDSHYFLCSLLDLVISRPLFDWIVSIYPEEVIPPSESSETATTPSLSESESESSIDGSSFYSSTSELEFSNLSLGSDDESDDESNDESNESDKQSENASSFVEYLQRGRLVNGRTGHLNIPSCYDLIKNGFFDELKKVPEDYLENESVTFEYHVL